MRMMSVSRRVGAKLLTLNEAVAVLLSVVDDCVVAADVDHLIVVHGEQTWLHMRSHSIKLSTNKLHSG